MQSEIQASSNIEIVRYDSIVIVISLFPNNIRDSLFTFLDLP